MGFYGQSLRGAFFGLHSVEGLVPDEFNVLYYAVRTSKTLHHAIENTSRYNRLFHDEAMFELEIVERQAKINHYFRTEPQGASWQAADFTLASIVPIGRAITGKQ